LLKAKSQKILIHESKTLAVLLPLFDSPCSMLLQMLVTAPSGIVCLRRIYCKSTAMFAFVKSDVQKAKAYHDACLW